MKKVALLFASCLIFSSNLNAQTVKIVKAGLVLTKQDGPKSYFVENTTNDSIKVVIINHQKKMEELPGDVIIMSNEEHRNPVLTIPPKTKMCLDGRVCIHSTGLQIGTADKSNLLKYKFYAKN
ncbi:MAG: hypothetical protein WCG55_02015 [bacterium]